MGHKDRRSPERLSSRRNIAWLKGDCEDKLEAEFQVDGQRTVVGMVPKGSGLIRDRELV